MISSDLKFTVRNLEGLEHLGYDGTIERTVLSKHKPSGKVSAVDLGGNRLSYADTNANYSADGVLSEHALSIGIVLACDSFRLRSVDTRPGDIAVLPANADIAGVHQGHARYFVMTVDTQRLIELAEFDGIDFDPRVFANPRIYRPGPDWAAFSAKYASNICASVSDFDFVRNDVPPDSTAVAKKLLADDLIRLMLHGLVQAETATVETDPVCRKGSAVVRNLLKALSSLENNSATLEALTLELGVSRRALYRAVHSELGISPARYLRQYRLSRAHLELVHTDKNNGSVSTTALKWGFADFGRFAGEYRQFFGQLPSVTLASQ